MNLLNSELKEILFKNDENVQEKFLNKLSADMSETDNEGHVYGYIPINRTLQKKNFSMKLGRTQKFNPEDRVKEWGGKLVFSVRTVCNKKLERLVHLIFKKWHVDVFNENTQRNEIEWFYFNENIHIATIVSMLNDIVIDMHTNNDITENNNENCENKKNNSVKKTQILNHCTNVININTASHEELMNLPGIGDKLADRIIAYRKNNNFITIEDIKKVPYIKNKVFDKCKDSITV